MIAVDFLSVVSIKSLTPPVAGWPSMVTFVSSVDIVCFCAVCCAQKIIFSSALNAPEIIVETAENTPSIISFSNTSRDREKSKSIGTRREPIQLRLATGNVDGPTAVCTSKNTLPRGFSSNSSESTTTMYGRQFADSTNARQGRGATIGLLCRKCPYPHPRVLPKIHFDITISARAHLQGKAKTR